MAKALINKHVDNSMELSREDFVQDFDKAKGEIIINNDELDPSIYILNTSGIVSKISANCDVYDDTEIREEVELLSNKVSSLNSTVNTLSGNEDVKGSVKNTVQRTKSVIDAYTVNNYKISENPVLDSNDLKVSDDYSAVNASYDHIIPGDIMTQAFGKIENMLTNTALCMAAAVNDIDARLGEPTEYNDKNKPIKKATGVYKLLEDINNNMALLHPDVYNPTLSNGGTITLYRAYRPLMPIIIKDAELNLNLNNQTVYAPTFAESKGNILDGDSDSYGFWVKEGGMLSIDGEGEVVARNAQYSMAVWANGGTAIIKNGKFYNGGDGCDLIYASNGGKVYIYGGEFHATERSGAESGTKNKYSALNIKDADRATSKIVVYGGKFYGFNPANNLSEGENTNFVAEGFESVEIEPNVWEVRVVGTVCLTESDLNTNGNAILGKDIKTLSPVVIENGESLNLNLNNKTITAGLFAESNGEITEGNTDSYGFWVKEGGELTLDGHGKVVAQDAQYSMAIWANGGLVNIMNGYYYNNGDGCDLIYASNGSLVNIYGGEFHATERSGAESGTKNKYSALNIKDSDRKSTRIVVYGGRFYGFDPANNVSEGENTNFVAEGYKSVEIEPGVFEVRIIK